MDESPHPRISGAITVSALILTVHSLITEDVRRHAVLSQDWTDGMPC